MTRAGARAWLGAAAALAGCGTLGSLMPGGGPAQAEATAPDFTAVATLPAPPQARLYGDCIAQAAALDRLARASRDGSELLLFTCVGEPARAFYDGLAGRSAQAGSEAAVNGRTYRSTNPVRRDLFGVDYCSTDGGGDYQCVITLNAGDFLASGG